MIKKCKNYPGYGADKQGNVYSYFKNIGGKWSISESPQKKLSPFFESPSQQRSQRRLCQFIRVDGRRVKKMIHQLIADAWLTRNNSDDVVLHKNDCATDNRVSNLMYGSKLVNAKQREVNIKKDITIQKLQAIINIYEKKYGKLP